MKISTNIRYGTRAMLELACHYGEGTMELREIAEKEDISAKYLEQVIVPLRTAGLVKSVRGSKGGYTLAKPPSDISLREIFEGLEGPVNLVDCLIDAEACQRTSTCVTREIWKEVSDVIEKIFSSVTLEEMVNRKRKKEGTIPSGYQI